MSGRLSSLLLVEFICSDASYTGIGHKEKFNHGLFKNQILMTTSNSTNEKDKNQEYQTLHLIQGSKRNDFENHQYFANIKL